MPLTKQRLAGHKGNDVICNTAARFSTNFNPEVLVRNTYLPIALHYYASLATVNSKPI